MPLINQIDLTKKLVNDQPPSVPEDHTEQVDIAMDILSRSTKKPEEKKEEPQPVIYQLQ
jgi:hypothetical protein